MAWLVVCDDAGERLIAEATGRDCNKQDTEHAHSGDGPGVGVREERGLEILLFGGSRGI